MKDIDSNYLLFQGMMETLNASLTRHPIEEVRQNFPFNKPLEEFVFGYGDVYYLADGGYSRVGISEEGKLFLTYNSLDVPKLYWTDNDVVILREKIEELIKNYKEALERSWL